MQATRVDGLIGAIESFERPIKKLVSTWRNILLHDSFRIRVRNHDSIFAEEKQIAALTKFVGTEITKKISLQEINTPAKYGQYVPLSIQNRRGQHDGRVMVAL